MAANLHENSPKVAAVSCGGGFTPQGGAGYNNSSEGNGYDDHNGTEDTTGTQRVTSVSRSDSSEGNGRNGFQSALICAICGK